MELLTDEDLLLSYEKAKALDDIDQVFITLLEEEIDKRGLLLPQAVTD
ncbi:sporulation histidine kinase inhibitor Sda [Lederbergia graminis]|uniref:Sporulation histidine kinase inhibitor Sda n=1 Tax=Lederbergia graminis TaxID=735518 RepID=A0ABW0LM11_9BACI|nr:sporulation histidine kinase inhibitor Sda [Bacillaceae bacterium]